MKSQARKQVNFESNIEITTNKSENSQKSHVDNAMLHQKMLGAYKMLKHGLSAALERRLSSLSKTTRTKPNKPSSTTYLLM